MAGPKIGCQLNPAFGDRTHMDLHGVLNEVREAGFDGVESGRLCQGDIAAAARSLDEHGLVQWSLHTMYQDGGFERVDEEIEYLNALKGKFVVVSGVGQTGQGGLRQYEEAAEVLNRVGERCRTGGLTFCYHNHGWEFQDFEGVTGLERLYELTDPDVVKLCIDVFWVRYGGRDPVEFLEKHLDRVPYVHLKDLKYVGPQPRREGVLRPIYPTLPLNGEAQYVELGRGEIDLPGIWRLLAPLDQPWVVYEQDEAAIPAGQAAAISRRYMRDHLGI